MNNPSCSTNKKELKHKYNNCIYLLSIDVANLTNLRTSKHVYDEI